MTMPNATLAARQRLGALACRKILPGLRLFLPLTTAAGSQDSSSKRAADYGYDATWIAAPKLKVFLQKGRDGAAKTQPVRVGDNEKTNRSVQGQSRQGRRESEVD